MQQTPCGEHPNCSLWDLQDHGPLMHVPASVTPARIKEIQDARIRSMGLAERIDLMYDLLDGGATYREAIDQARLRQAKWMKVVRLAYLSWTEEQDDDYTVEEDEDGTRIHRGDGLLREEAQLAPPGEGRPGRLAG